jgi:hypothetical protein
VPGLLVAIVLIASLILVHFSIRAQPMPLNCPLNVDEGLPLPEAGQASTVFSLTALFGAYFGIALMLGLPALLGLAFGTALGFLLIRTWIDEHNPERFEPFLFGLLKGNEANAAVYALLICGVQCAYAASELLILREIAKVSLGVRADQATLVAVGVAVIGYFYVLNGGYVGVFRTDVIQFLLVGAMGVVFGIFLLDHKPAAGFSAGMFPRPGYWKLPVGISGLPLYVYHFGLAAVMGLGLLAASPDAWKRVFMARKKAGRRGVRFLFFVIAGTLPFLMLFPFALAIGPIPDGIVITGQIFSSLLNGDVLFVVAALGLIASFLSSFDGALLASVHLGLMLRRKRSEQVLPTQNEMSRFHWLMVAALLTVFLLFRSLVGFTNPYLLGNLLLGPYALIAGIQVGTRGNISRLRKNSVLWVTVLGILGWFFYFVSTGIPKLPTTYQINTVPGGVLLFLVIALTCKALVYWRAKE